MYERFEKTLIANCAATLAGHRAGSLFSYRLTQKETPDAYITRLNALIGGKGVAVRLLKFCARCCLVYVYRPSLLDQRLRADENREFLSACGYEACRTPDEHLCVLARRIYRGNNFPMETGIFLDRSAGECGLCGCGPVCGGCPRGCAGAEAARRLALYEKCRAVYMERYRGGCDIARLTVAC